MNNSYSLLPNINVNYLKSNKIQDLEINNYINKIQNDVSDINSEVSKIQNELNFSPITITGIPSNYKFDYEHYVSTDPNNFFYGTKWTTGEYNIYYDYSFHNNFSFLNYFNENDFNDKLKQTGANIYIIIGDNLVLSGTYRNKKQPAAYINEDIHFIARGKGIYKYASEIILKTDTSIIIK